MWLLKQTEIGIGWVGLREVSILSEAGREALHSPPVSHSVPPASISALPHTLVAVVCVCACVDVGMLLKSKCACMRVCVCLLG